MNMKKALSFVLMLCMLLSVCAPSWVFAEEGTGEFSYTVENGEATIVGYNGEGGDIVIPSEIDGYPVVAIGYDAFEYNNSITSVVISEGIKYINADAFEECHNLQSALIPDSVISIGSWAFGWCYALTEITIPASVETMSGSVFVYSNSLENIYCEAESMPEGWAIDWLNYCDATAWFDGVEYERPEYYYYVENDSAYITQYNGNDSEVTIPSKLDGYPVAGIDYGAFAENSTLQSVVIPDGVEYIGGEAFFGCVNLQSALLPDGMLSINGRAFAYCSALTEITIPASVEFIGQEAFAACYAMTDIYCEAESMPEDWNSYWLNYCDATVWFDGVEYERPEYYYYIENGEVTITEYVGEGGDVVIPSEISGCPVTAIGYDAFSYNSSITSVVIPDGVKYIGDEAFEECYNLQSVLIPDSVISIGSWAFGWCYALIEITIPASVETMGSRVFTRNNMQNIYCEAASQPETWAEDWAENCYATVHWSACAHRDTTQTEVVVAPDCTQDGERYLQCGSCGRACSVVERIPATGHTPGEDMFCTVCGVHTEFEYDIYDDGYFAECIITNYIGSGGNIVIPSEIGGYPVVAIDAEAFAYNDSVTSVVLPDSVLLIGTSAFIECTALTEITIPASVEFVGSYAFAYCGAMTDIYCEAESLPASWNAFWLQECNATVWFDGVEYERPEFLCNIEYDEAIIVGYDGEGGDIVIPSEIEGYPVVAIESSAFAYNDSITSVVIPDCVTSIGAWAFEVCDVLTEITIPASVEFVGGYAFAYCDSLTDIYCEAESLPEGWDAFWLRNCDATVWFDGVEYERPEYYYYVENGEATIIGYDGKGGDIVIPSELGGCPVTAIGYDAFSYNDSITSVVIPDGVKHIRADAFEECHYLQSVLIPDSVVSIERWAFGWCYELTEITIPASVKTMDSSVFTRSYNLQNIYCEIAFMPAGWNEYWLEGCSATVTWGDVLPGGDNLAYGKQYEISEQFRMSTENWGYDESYPVSYPDEGFELTDGYVPSDEDASYAAECWMAFHNNTPAQQERGYAYIIIDLGELCSIDSIDITALKQTSAGITCPYKIEYMVSEDGESWTSAGVLDISGELDSYADNSVHTLTYELDASARYVEVRVTSYGWAFLGELEIHGERASDVTYGDVNGDDKINGRDVTKLLQYLANYDPDTDSSSVEIGDGADCNGDAKINGRDVTRLLQYLANYDPDTDSSSVTLGK